MARTNILLITSDQQHWNTLGCLNPEIKTPCLDKLAEEGTLFTRAYCPNPTCTPTRASIITGKYPSQHGAWSLGTKLDEKEHVVGDDFKAAGYKTALVGKAHFQPLKSTEEYPSLEAYPVLQDLDFWRTYDKPFYGFDRVELARNHTDEAHVGQHYALWMEEKGFTDWKKHFLPPTGTKEPSRGTWDIPEEYHYNAWIAERSCSLMEEYAEKDEPFFLWSSFFDPHPTYLVPKPWDTMYDPDTITVPEVVEGEHDANPPHHQETQKPRAEADFSPWRETDQGNHGMHSHVHDKKELAKDIATYYGMVSCMDKYIGKIVDRLDELGLAENTLIVFTTDHGHFFGHHGLTAKGPFHYEDMVKIPFIVRQPGTIPAGKRSEALQTLVDLAPSFLKHCDLPVPLEMTGVDETPVWKGEAESARDHVVVEHHHQPTAIHLKTFIDERYKLTAYYNQPYGELFDLQDDPDEVKNLWDSPEHQNLKHDLVMKLLFAEMGKEPMWMPRIYGA